MTTNVKVELKTDVELNGSELRVSDNSLTMSVRMKTDTDSEGRDSSVESDHKFDLNTYIGCREVGDKERLFCKWSDCHYESNQRTSISRHIQTGFEECSVHYVHYMWHIVYYIMIYREYYRHRGIA
ncbi:unnamed protein product [Oppiella nova]|uniref:Uncharacterized protein n=1 Tax=Oppiella nova TaxID=334625 RepID=A0A7R9LC30_9ACAR|nr:unnamed protein product [Oppiella nova]CAG2161470.1 unnamed protein product [Oppiella nova]